MQFLCSENEHQTWSRKKWTSLRGVLLTDSIWGPLSWTIRCTSTNFQSFASYCRFKLSLKLKCWFRVVYILIGLLLTSWEWPLRVLSKLAIFTVSFGPSSPLNCCTHAAPWCLCRMRMTSASYHGDMSKDHEMHSNIAPIFAIFAVITRKEELQRIPEFFFLFTFFLHAHIHKTFGPF